MRDVNQLIQRAEAAGYPQRHGASDTEIARITPAFTRAFGMAPPADYVHLLRTANGLEFDGVVWYGTADQHGPDGVLPGVLESTERLVHGVESIDTPLRFVGEAGDLLLAFDVADQRWKAVTRYGWASAPEFSFATFGELFTAVMATTDDTATDPDKEDR